MGHAEAEGCRREGRFRLKELPPERLPGSGEAWFQVGKEYAKN